MIVAHRDALHRRPPPTCPGRRCCSSWRACSPASRCNHTVVLASTTGSAGAAGAERLARTLPQPVDAVIVLGDLAGTGVHGPVVVPWSDGQSVAPPMLRNTLASALAAQTGPERREHRARRPDRAPGVPDEPDRAGAVRRRGRAGGPAVGVGRADAVGRRAGQPQTRSPGWGGRCCSRSPRSTPARPCSAPSSYLVFSGKAIPAWAVRLLVLMLILPVLVATVDGLARARRRGHSILRWSAWVLAAAVPFVLVVAVIVIARAGWAARRAAGPARRRRRDASRRTDRRRSPESRCWSWSD